MTTLLEAPTRLQRTAPHCHAWVQPPGGWCLNNAGLVVGPGGASLLVDTVATESRARALAAAVRETAGEPTYLVNTHFHGDHTFGNHLFPASTLVRTRTTRDLCEMAGDSLCSLWPETDWGKVGWGSADLVFDTHLGVDLGGLEVELLEVGPAHTPSDIVVWVPDSGVLYTGDVAWNGVTPFLMMGSAVGTLTALERLTNLEPEVVVPGHGPVGGVAVLHQTREYVEWLLELATDAAGRGLTGAEAAREARNALIVPDLLDAERLLPNLERAMAELCGAAPGASIDVAGSFTRMVQFHGSHPTCMA